MKKQVSPVVAVVLVLVALATIQFAYWRGLVGEKSELPKVGAEKAAGGAEGREPPPAGSPAYQMSTLAGSPEPGYKDGTARTARFSGPAAVAVAGDGSVYVADSRNHVIRRIAPTGSVETFAGRPDTGFGGFADGPARQARFAAPAGIAALPGGGLLVSDTGNHRIRRVAPDGTVSTFAGAATPQDDVGRLVGGHRDGAAAQALFRYPVGLAVDGSGAVYVADSGNHCVRRVANGAVTTIPTTGAKKLDTPTQVALVGGQLWVTDVAAGSAWVGPTTGPLQRQELKLAGKPLTAPSGVAASGDGAFLLDAGSHCLYNVAAGKLSLAVGQFGQADYFDGPGDTARLAEPAGLAIGPGGIYVADFGNNCIRRVHREGH